jgi:hypothetical protein
MNTSRFLGRARMPVAFLVELAALAAAAGCTSLLGDFSTGAAADAGSDGTLNGDAPGDDATGPEASQGGDDAADSPNDVPAMGDASDGAADGPPAPIACTTWVYANPMVLDTLTTGTRRVVAPLKIFNTPQGVMRVVAGKNGTIPFSLYSVDRTAMPATTSKLDGPSYAAAFYSAVHRSPGKVPGYTVILASTKTVVSAPATYNAFVLYDAMSSLGPVPAPFPAYQVTAGQAAPVQTQILPLQTVPTVELFTAVDNLVTGPPATYTLGVGIATASPSVPATPSPVASSLTNDFVRMQLFHDSANSKIFIYSQNDVSTPGFSGWWVPDTLPADAAAPTKRTIGGLSAILHDIGENGAQAAADIAYEEDTLNGVFLAGIAYRVGTIPYSGGGGGPNLNSWVSTDLPVVKNFTGNGVFDAPFGIPNGSLWVNDNIMLIGPGASVRSNIDASNGGVPYGLNLLWLDASGNVRSIMTGANRLMPTLGDFSAIAATPISIAPDGKTAKWAIAWVETKTDDAGSYDVVEYNELSCL